MNTGIIASRYALALLKLVDETGGGELVVKQVEFLQDALRECPDLERVVNDEVVVQDDRKLSLFEAALGGEKMAPELRKFLSLLMKNGRITDCKFAFHAFVSEYYRSRGIRRGRLVVAAPSSGLAERIDKLIEDNTGWNLRLESVVNPDLIGGLVLEIEDYRLDASVAAQLETIRHQFVERNRRIV